MNSVELIDAVAAFDELIARVERGEAITITRGCPTTSLTCSKVKETAITEAPAVDGTTAILLEGVRTC